MLDAVRATCDAVTKDGLKVVIAAVASMGGDLELVGFHSEALAEYTRERVSEELERFSVEKEAL